MKTTAKQIATILFASAVLAVAAIMVHPRRIPWVHDWSNQIEAQAAEKDIRLIPLSVALDLFESNGVTFIDARSGDEFTRGHIPNAVSIPFERLDDALVQIAALIDGGDALVVYCGNRVCDDALLLASEIKTMGGDAALFIDGFESWAKHGGRVAL